MTCIATLRMLFRGQTRQIMQLAEEVRGLRAFLMVSEGVFVRSVFDLHDIQTTSEEEKARKVDELRRTQVNRSPETDQVLERTSGFNSVTGWRPHFKLTLYLFVS
jgi:hypothetical protein